MASNKLARTNDDIQRVLANLLTQVKDPRVQQGMISVTRVETTGDLRYTPELVFEIDHSIEEGAHISALIERLHDSDTGSEA